MTTINQLTRTAPSWTTFRGLTQTQQNRVASTSPEITLITIDADDWTPAEGYDLVALWHKGRGVHQAAPRGSGVVRTEYGHYHYDAWQAPVYRTCPIGAVYVALFGARSIEIMPEYELLIARICNQLGCTRQELEAL